MVAIASCFLRLMSSDVSRRLPSILHFFQVSSPPLVTVYSSVFASVFAEWSGNMEEILAVLARNVGGATNVQNVNYNTELVPDVLTF